MKVRLTDLLSGVVAVSAPSGFPLETSPPQGKVLVEFATGNTVEISADSDEFGEAHGVIAKRRPSDTTVGPPNAGYYNTRG